MKAAAVLAFGAILLAGIAAFLHFRVAPPAPPATVAAPDESAKKLAANFAQNTSAVDAAAEQAIKDCAGAVLKQTSGATVLADYRSNVRTYNDGHGFLRTTIPFDVAGQRRDASCEWRMYNGKYEPPEWAARQAALDERMAFQDKPPAIGMASWQARATTWGSPDKVNKTTTARGTREQWVYGSGRYLYFDNDRLTAIQQ